MTQNTIGPDFPAALQTAGLVGLPFSWDANGNFNYGSDMTAAQIAAVQAVYAAYVPNSIPFAQSQQIGVLSAACQAAIYAGFTSSALGSVYTYPAQDTDQLNMASSVLASLVALGAAEWAADTAYAVGATVTEGNQAYICTTAGTSGAEAPTWPTSINTPATDGNAAWEIWTTPFWCEDASSNWDYMSHTAAQIQKAGQDGKTAIITNLIQNKTLAAQVSAATTVAAVQAIVWPSTQTA